MSGTISCGKMVTEEVSSDNTLKIGTSTWPSGTPSSGSIMKIDGSGNIIFERTNIRSDVGSLSTTYSISTSDDIVAITGLLDTTITLPDPSTKVMGDFIYIVKEVSGTSIITVVPFGSETISGGSDLTFSNSYGAVKIYTNGTDWFSLSQ